MRQKKTRIIFTNFVLVIISLAITIIVIEASLAILSHFFYPRLTVSDPTLGWKYKPTQKKVTRHSYKNITKTITYDVYINREGFRDDEFIVDNGYFKIMALGDSITFGLEANQEELFCSLLERKIINTYHNKNIDVMNFGITGFSTGQELLCLRKYGDIYHPNVVILMLFEANDFDENASIFSAGRYVPHFVIRDGQLLLCNSPSKLQKTLTFLRDKSFLFYILSTALNITRYKLSRVQTLSEEDKMSLMCKILDEIHRYTEAKGIPLFIFYILTEDPDNQRFLGVQKYYINKNVFFEVAPFISEERICENDHWNSEEHRLMAEIIYEKLSKINVLDDLAK